MLIDIINALKSQGVDVKDGANANGLTQLSAAYFSLVSGGATLADEACTYGQYGQNWGDNGPHPQPYWQDITC